MVRTRRLVNPSRRRRRRNAYKMSSLQKLFFGTKRQRAAAKANRGRRRKKNVTYVRRVKKGQYLYKNPTRRRRKYNRSRRRKNIASIMTVYGSKGLLGLNPGKKRRKRVARRRKNARKKIIIVNRGVKVARTRRRRHNRSRRRYNTHRRRYNPTAVRHHRRRRSYGRRGRRRMNRGRRHYRRNPGMLSGTVGRIVGVLGGIALTRVLVGFVPASLSTGILGYLTTGAVAVLQGKLVGKVTKNGALGNDFMVGGLAYMLVKVINDFFPSIGSYTGISGMGLIGGSSFYIPQVNANGSMGSFVLPSAVSGAIPVAAPATGGSLGRLRRTGRLI